MNRYTQTPPALETADSSTLAVTTNARTSGRGRSACSARLASAGRSFAADRRGRSGGAAAGSRVHNRERSATAAATPAQAVVRRFVITATADNHHRLIDADRAVASTQTGPALASAV